MRINLKAATLIAIVGIALLIVRNLVSAILTGFSIGFGLFGLAMIAFALLLPFFINLYKKQK